MEDIGIRVSSRVTANLPAALLQTRIFSRLSEQEVFKLVPLCSHIHFPEGDVIYRPGELAEEVYFLITGMVEISYGAHASPLRLAVQQGRYDMFGWASILPHRKHRIATATVLSPSVVLQISGARLLALLEQHPTMGFSVMREFNAHICTEIKAIAAG